MPQLLVTSAINNDVYSYTICNVADKFTQSDKALINKYGEPVINTGGTFGSSPNIFTLPDNYIRVISGLPFTQTFDSTSPPFDTNILTKTAAWLAAFETAYSDAFTTLRAESDTFSTQQLFNV
jgi:hypothetical protein